ncbi:MAG: hypothetical protein HYU35_00190 [Parcubacteria group bacterium]|nr:hypothetical protein [Parcubacteria group bacterium]
MDTNVGIGSRLVRDGIPKEIENHGEIPITHIASEEEFRQALLERLREEVEELIASKTPEQVLEKIVDVHEVLQEIASSNGIGPVTIGDARRRKMLKAGGFKNRTILEEVRTPPA